MLEAHFRKPHGRVYYLSQLYQAISAAKTTTMLLPRLLTAIHQAWFMVLNQKTQWNGGDKSYAEAEQNPGLVNLMKVFYNQKCAIDKYNTYYVRDHKEAALEEGRAFLALVQLQEGILYTAYTLQPCLIFSFSH